MPDQELIHVSIHEAEKQNQYAEVLRVHCCLPGGPEECPHYRERRCLQVMWLNLSPCLYSRTTVRRSGSTKRGQAYWKFVKEAKAELAELLERRPRIDFAGGKLVQIGEYVVVPFSHATDCKEVPFHRHGHLMSNGVPWIKVEEFTPEVAAKIARFVPRSLSGHPIESYQREEVPKFLYQLKLRFPEIYAGVAEIDPSIVEKTPRPEDFAGKLVPVSMLPPGEVKLRYDLGRPGSKDARTILADATWDGETITTKMRSGDLTYLAGYATEITVTFVPNEKTTAVPTPEDMEGLWKAGAFEKHDPKKRDS